MRFFTLLLVTVAVFVEPDAASSSLVSSSRSQKRELFDESKIKFYLWNKNTIEQEVEVGKYGNFTKAPTKFLIHGYRDEGNGEDTLFYAPMVAKYVKMGANVVCVDWSFYSKMLYVQSVLWMKSIADLIGRFITGLKQLVTFDDIHLIGHSLGAHMAGFIGKWIQLNNGGQKLGRISGIDPAGPLFYRRPSSDRLSPTDATNVDSIIADILKSGMNETLGQVNFYVWCGGHPLLFDLNHYLAVYYFAYGILRKDLIGRDCKCRLQKMEDCKPLPVNILGENVDFKKSGTYYLNIDIPNALNDTLEAEKSIPTVRGTTIRDKFFKIILNLLANSNIKAIKT